MSDTLLYRLRAPTHFLRGDAAELRRLFPDLLRLLPVPRPILFHPSAGAPLYGFPLLDSPDLDELGIRLEEYLHAEERFEGEGIAPRRDQDKWGSYRDLLLSLSENLATTSYARDYPQIFWLFHSRQVAKVLSGTPRRGRSMGLSDEESSRLRYRVLERYLRRCTGALHELAERLARETEEPEVELFPRIVTAMRDNLLVFAEIRIGPGLQELRHYARGHLGIDPDDFRRRFDELVEWESRLLREEPDFEAAVSGLVDRHGEPGRFFERGYLSYLASLSSYPSESLFARREVAAWEGLVLRLKEFELFDGLRHLIVRLRSEGDQYRCDPRDAERIGAPKHELFTRTRPVDFMAPWLVDPEVSRGGLIYDISKFTATVSRLGKNEYALQDRAFRALVRFQRRFDHLAHSLGLRFEKYLGDGAFYSGVELESLLVAVVLMQRYYRRSVDTGFPFKEGMRIALNYGDYRLMPFGDRRKGDARYEAFGHGVVELSRLVSGKPGPTLEEIRAELVRLGYEDWLVRNFLAPIERRRGLGSPGAPRRRRAFRAFIEHDGTLANEGIVATEHFLRELSKSWKPSSARRGALDGSLCVLVELEHRDHAISIALRKLGTPNLKGIEDLAVFEVIDRDAHNVHDLGASPAAPLMELLEDAYNASPTRMI